MAIYNTSSSHYKFSFPLRQRVKQDTTHSHSQKGHLCYEDFPLHPFFLTFSSLALVVVRRSLGSYLHLIFGKLIESVCMFFDIRPQRIESFPEKEVFFFLLSDKIKS